MRALALVLALLLPRPATAQPAPAPLFHIEQVGALCGALADHLRVLEDNGFEGVWRGAAGQGGGAFVMVNHESYWVLLLVPPQSPDRACVVADGPRFEYSSWQE